MNAVRGSFGARVWTSIAVGLWVLGCASQQGKQGKESSAAGEQKQALTPEEIEALFAREKELPGLREAKAPDGAWTAQFPSDTEITMTAGSRHQQAEMSLGTEATTKCVFYREAIDAGQAVATMLAGVRQKATLQKVSTYRIASAQGTPIVFLEARYEVARPGGKQVGGLKLAITSRLQTPVLCYLDEPGYRETFSSAVTGILTTLQVAEPSNEPNYTEIWTISVDDVTLGYQWLQMFDEGQGKRTTVMLSSAFIPKGPGELMTTDAVEVLKSDASGVLEGTFSEVEGGQVQHDLALSRSGKSKYSVTGKVEGKDFKSEFTAQKLPDDIASYRLLVDNHKKNTSLTSAEFDPSLDPRAPTKVSYAIDGKARTVTIRMGEMSLLGTFTAEGLVSQVDGKAGGLEFKQEIIHRAGKF